MMPPRTTGPRQPSSHGQGHRVRREPPHRNGPRTTEGPAGAQPRCRTSAHGADPTARPATPMQTGGDRPKTLQPRAPASTWAADLHKSTSACYAPCTRHHTNATVPARTRSASTPQRVRPSRADAPQAAAAHPVPAGLVADTIAVDAFNAAHKQAKNQHTVFITVENLGRRWTVKADTLSTGSDQTVADQAYDTVRSASSTRSAPAPTPARSTSCCTTSRPTNTPVNSPPRRPPPCSRPHPDTHSHRAPAAETG